MSDMPEQPATQKAENFLTPASFIRAAKAAHPAFRYAIAAAGVLAIVVTFVKFGVGYATLVFGAIALIGLMVLFLVFAQASKLTKSTLAPAAQALVWAILVIAIAIVVFLTVSVFFNMPLPFRDWIIRDLANAGHSTKPLEETPAEPITTTETYYSDNAASGACKDLGAWASVCSPDKPAGWTITYQHFDLSGDRAGCQYAVCEPEGTITDTKVCYHFRTQGHDEECGHSGNTGIHYSKGVLTVVWRRPGPPQQQSQIQQKTTGPGSPTINGVQGDVSVTVDQTSSKSQPQKEQKKNQQSKKEE